MSAVHAAADQLAFVTLRARLRAMVWRIVERGRVDDPEALEAEVWLRVWRHFAIMARREERQRARGLPGHRWRQWVSRVARRMVVDEQRRSLSRRRAVGVRAFAPPEGYEAADGVRGAQPWGLGRGEPLDVDACPTLDELADPVVFAERSWERETIARGLARLSALEAAVVTRRAGGVSTRLVASELGLTQHAVRRLEREAIARLRKLFRD